MTAPASDYVGQGRFRRVRRARRRWRCTFCLGGIEPGESYVEHRSAPNGDTGYRWWTLQAHQEGKCRR